MKKNAKNRSPVVQKTPPEKNPDVNELLAIMARLRGPPGCPWDREQTEQTLKKYLIEEAYEVLEAIETGEIRTRLKEELGDLLLQIVFLAQIAAEKRQFSFADVVHTLVLKAHPAASPHFSLAAPESSDPPQNGQEVRKIWREVKEQETEGQTRKNSCSMDFLWAFPP